MFQTVKKDRKPILKYHWEDCSSILLPLVTLAYKFRNVAVNFQRVWSILLLLC